MKVLVIGAGAAGMMAAIAAAYDGNEVLVIEKIILKESNILMKYRCQMNRRF